MEDSGGKMNEEQEFALALVAELYSNTTASPGIACFTCDAQLRINIESQQIPLILDLLAAQLFKLTPVRSAFMVAWSETSFFRAVFVEFNKKEDSLAFHCVFQQRKNAVNVQGQDIPNEIVSTSKSKFDEKIDPSAAKIYFQYYGKVLHQQKILQDFVKTGTYHAAINVNKHDFFDRVVVDVGAGCGILSLFASQSGARHVYAVEASEMAEHAKKLISENPVLGQKITVIKGKVEDVELPDLEKADVLISEPMGNMLVDGRMLESYIIARDRFLKPNGKMFPSIGRIHMAPFSNERLFEEKATKALFWQQQNYCGVDLRPLHGAAMQETFSLPTVDIIDPRALIASSMFHEIDFTKIKEEDLYEINIPLKFKSTECAKVHGLACWFGVLFDGSTVNQWLTTAPGSPPTRWPQVCCVLSQPIYVTQGQVIRGELHLIAHNEQSYTMNLTLAAMSNHPGNEEAVVLQTSSGQLDLKEAVKTINEQ